MRRRPCCLVKPFLVMKQIPNKMFFAWVESEIAEGHSVRFRLKGDSMLPLLRNGKDDVVLYPCKREELRPFDVVLFRYKGLHVLHRIIRIEGERLYLRGDGSIVAKEECAYSDVVGKVQQVIRPSGKTITLTSWKWKVASTLWVKSGVLRVLILKVLLKMMNLRVLCAK